MVTNTKKTFGGLLVVVSQGQSRSPDKRALEESVAAAAVTLPKTTCLVVPNLYDLAGDGESVKKLQAWQGPIVLLSWLFDRAAFWILDRNMIRGQYGHVELLNPDTMKEDDEEDEDGEKNEVDEKRDERVAHLNKRQNRNIYSIDLRASASAADYLKEFQRIYDFEQSNAPETELLSLERFLAPTNSTAMSLSNLGTLDSGISLAAGHQSPLGIVPLKVEEHPTRRWYPVIDYSRCTNCMECIDFCLFGVYGVDRAETILVEQPDNCRKGCPACSRVCPENAIMFPQHKTPAIAGAPVDAGGFKIDLSKLFGAPERDEDPVAAAARERDEQLILAGRAAVGLKGLEPSAEESAAQMVEAKPPRARDELDSLIDQLDSLDL